MGSRWSYKAIQKLCLPLTVWHHEKNKSAVLPLQTAWLYFPGNCIRQQKCSFGARFQRDVISLVVVNLTVG